MRTVAIAVITALVAHQAAAHGTVNSVAVGGTQYEGYEPSNAPGTQPNPAKGVVWASNDWDIGFVLPEEYGNADIICHKNSSPAPKAAEVAAGGTISLSWPNWPKTDPHPGVFLNYLAAAGTDDPASIDKNALKFFKISQAGYDPSVDVNGPDKGLATGSFKKAGLVAQVTIPASLKAGTYVLRHEIIALHEAEEPDKAQNYPQCVTIKVTGGGSAAPDGVPGTALYQQAAPGILVKNFYDNWDPKAYQMPGPAVWDGASSGTGTGTATTGTAGSVSPVPSTGTGTSTGTASVNSVPSSGSAPTGTTAAPKPSSTGEVEDEGGDDGEEEDDEEDQNTGSGNSGTSRHRHGGSKSRWYRNRKQQNERRHPRDLMLGA